MPANILGYKIFSQDMLDTPAKTQLAQNILIQDKGLTEQKIRSLLNYLYQKAMLKTGFQYHDSLTNVYIYAFTSPEKAKSGMGQWIGMISKSYGDHRPEISISQTQMQALNEKPNKKWGLSYEKRKAIWTKIIKAEDSAQFLADQKYPIDKPNTTHQDIVNNIDLDRALIKKYHVEMAYKNNIDTLIIDSISIEGIKNGWAFPERDL